MNGFLMTGCGRSARGTLLRLMSGIVVMASLAGATTAVADGVFASTYTEQDLRGTWVWSGLLRFGAPLPIPATIVSGAPPHDVAMGGDVVGVWASTVGLMSFDGNGNVGYAEEVTKVGETVPLPGFPLEYLPPFPEVYTGSYTVNDHGVVQIALVGRNLPSPEGQVDFEYDLHCVLKRSSKEMKCVPARFRTYVVDPNGYHAPITGIIDFERRP